MGLRARVAPWQIWPIGVLLGFGCGTDRSDSAPDPAPAPAPLPPGDPAAAGKVRPTPDSELDFGREVFSLLQRGDWEGYTNLLVTRADLLPLFEGHDRGDRRERRRRRRMVWRRVNRLRGGGAEEGWTELRRTAEAQGVRWDAASLVDVRRAPIQETRLPPEATTAQLRLVIEQDGVHHAIDLGTSLRAKRGWVSLYPLQWRGAVSEPFGQSVMIGPPP